MRTDLHKIIYSGPAIGGDTVLLMSPKTYVCTHAAPLGFT